MEKRTTIREILEDREEKILHPKAALAKRSQGRLRDEKECDLRTCFQRDRDRVIHCKSFRRLKHKTQVFLAPKGDHYRTRLTHTLEVSQIARSISRSLGLNEDLTEAISLSHDLGHTPFGHAGERVLNALMSGGFKHAHQSLRVIDHLEYNGKGLNLSFEVRNGIVKHSKGEHGQLARIFDRSCATLEGDVVRISDVIAYVNHDIDDAIRANIISDKEIPMRCREILGKNSPKRIDALVKDIVYRTRERNLERLTMNDEIRKALVELRSFLFERVYENERSKKEFQKAEKILKDLHMEILKHPERYFLEEIERERAKRQKIFVKASKSRMTKLPKDVVERLTFDFLAGMTDRYAISLFEQLFIPAPWTGSDLSPT